MNIGRFTTVVKVFSDISLIHHKRNWGVRHPLTRCYGVPLDVGLWGTLYLVNNRKHYVNTYIEPVGFEASVHTWFEKKILLSKSLIIKHNFRLPIIILSYRLDLHTTYVNYINTQSKKSWHTRMYQERRGRETFASSWTPMWHIRSKTSTVIRRRY